MQSFLTSLTGQVQPRVITNLGPRTERGGASDQRAAHDQVIEQLTDHSQVLLGTRLSNFGA
jgi:hypothetical protein